MSDNCAPMREPEAHGATDQVLAGQRWTFDGDVTAAFADMLARSIPQYDIMRQACYHLALHHAHPQTDIVDLGCSRGAAMAPLVDKLGVHNRFVGLEVSPSMLEAARERFRGLMNVGVVDIRDFDLRTGYPPVAASVTLCILTLQFVPIEYRQRIVRDVYAHTVEGGAFILVEKVLGASADIDAEMVDQYYTLKRANGYSEEQIERKRLSLEGVLVPVTARWNEELLRGAGFGQVDCFWRWMNFAGWLAVKGS